VKHELALFRPDDLSAESPVLENCPSGAASRARGLLRREYGIAEEPTIRRFAGPGVVSENLLVEAGGARYVLKTRRGRQARRLPEELELAERVSARGVPVPPVFRTLDGRRVLSEAGGTRTSVLFRFVDGTYFRGTDAELADAGRVFALIADPERDGRPPEPGGHHPGEIATDLRELLALAVAGPDAVGEICRRHRHELQSGIEEIDERGDLLCSQQALIHTDYHPLNLLMSEGRVTCVLDFEDVQRYPVSAALGFGGYKLIRAAILARGLKSPLKGRALPWVRGWRDAWQARFPGSTYSPSELGVGARFRVLSLIQLILGSHLRDDDPRLNYDLPKQVRSLYEIVEVFGGAPNRPDG
jgi:hypothetical protein